MKTMLLAMCVLVGQGEAKATKTESVTIPTPTWIKTVTIPSTTATESTSHTESATFTTSLTLPTGTSSLSLNTGTETKSLTMPTGTSTMSLITGTDSASMSLATATFSASPSVSSSLSIATRTETIDPTIPMHSLKFKIQVKDTTMSYDAGSTGSIAVHFVKEGHPTWYWGSLSGLAAGEAQTYHVNGSPYSFSEIDNVVLIAFMSTTDNLLVEAVWLQHIASGFWKKYLVREPKQLLCCGEEMVETWYPTC
eukprot:TRINITY_DN130_c0_g1_i1.p1 TRINITY_DN130_c0_g1~~TRINITY_DN130_c0_g1_i1.p1  ORF type:complete len:252 (+),score=36.89 TRINITY_DN130_c0_g1_i1:70-825(+)